MNKEVKEKWVAALTSGEYKQGSHALKDNDRYCCLGVLCDLYAKEKAIPSFDVDGVFLEERALLPKEVMAWAEIEDPAGLFVKNGEKANLTTLNDDGLPFERIAVLINDNL